MLQLRSVPFPFFLFFMVKQVTNISKIKYAYVIAVNNIKECAWVLSLFEFAIVHSINHFSCRAIYSSLKL